MLLLGLSTQASCGSQLEHHACSIGDPTKLRCSWACWQGEQVGQAQFGPITDYWEPPARLGLGYGSSVLHQKPARPERFISYLSESGWRLSTEQRKVIRSVQLCVSTALHAAGVVLMKLFQAELSVVHSDTDISCTGESWEFRQLKLLQKGRGDHLPAGTRSL